MLSEVPAARRHTRSTRQLPRVLVAPGSRHAAGCRELIRRLRGRAGDERGVSLVELLVTMVLMAIVGGSLNSVIVSAVKAEARTNRSFQAQQQGRLALDKLRRELHCASSVAVVNGSGITVAAGVSGNGINAILGGYCPTNGLTSDGSQSVYVTWCTLASTQKPGDYALYRRASLSSQPSCSTSGTQPADYLTTATPFCLPSTTAACGGVLKSVASLSTLHVTLPVNLNGPTSAKETFNLVDDIALRGSARG